MVVVCEHGGAGTDGGGDAGSGGVWPCPGAGTQSGKDVVSQHG